MTMLKNANAKQCQCQAMLMLSNAKSKQDLTNYKDQFEMTYNRRRSKVVPKAAANFIRQLKNK